MAKSLSATMEELSHERLSAFITNSIGNLPLSNSPPDILGFGSALVTSVLLACGLKQAGALRTAMNVVGVAGLIFFLSVGGTHTKDETFDGKALNPHQTLTGAGVICCLFIQFLELGRRSKTKSKAKVILPLAISFTCIFVFLLSISLGILLTFMLDDGERVSGAPLLRALMLRDVVWGRLTMGSFQIVMLGLGIGEAGESLCRQLVSMASNGFIPSFFSLECQMAFSYSRAHLIGGIGASVMALFLSHIYLLEFMAANILLLNILMILVTMYGPFRCSYDSLFSTSATTSSRNQKASSSSRLKTTKNSSVKSQAERTLHFLKNGIHVLALRKPDSVFSSTEDEIGMPLLSSTQFGIDSDDASLLAAIEEQEYKPRPSKSFEENIRDRQNCGNEAISCLSECSGAGSTSECYENDYSIRSDINRNDCELLCLKEPPVSSEESEEEESGEQEEFIPEEDVDTIISEYKEQLRISTVGSGIKPLPTILTARKAILCILILTLLSIFLSVFCLYFPGKSKTMGLTLSLKSLSGLSILLVMFGVLVMLSQLPTLKRSPSTQNGFRLPGSIWICFIALFLNISLFVEIFSRTIWTVLPLHIFAFVWYIFYSSKYSSVAISRRYDGLTRSEEDKDNEMVCLAPVFPTSVYTSRPQKDGLNRKI